MNKRIKFILAFFGLLSGYFFLASESAYASETWKAGYSISSFTVSNQDEKSTMLDSKVRLLIFARDMQSSKLVTGALDGTPQAKLDERGVMYIADISGMPGLIAKMVAIPKMRKYTYSVYLDREGDLSKSFPVKDKHVTVMMLKNLKIESVQYFSSSSELRKAILESP